MEADELTEIDFHKGIAIHHQEIGHPSEVGLCQSNGTCGAQRLMLRRVLNRHTPCMTIAEFQFDVMGAISSTHHQTADALASQLMHQQLQKWPLAE
jgi:hypothetical protein